MKKHPIENYKHYTLYAVSGTNPAFFIAEKADPTKGCTLTADSLDELKKNIDDSVSYALRVKINIYEGPQNNQVLQNITARINSQGFKFDGIAIVVSCDYDLEAVIAIQENPKIRLSKKYKKKRNKFFDVSRFLKRSRTICQGR